MSIFGRVYPLQQFFIQVQPELNYVWGSGYFPSINQSEYSKVNQFVPSLVTGRRCGYSDRSQWGHHNQCYV